MQVVGTVTEIRGKTEQRVSEIISILKDAASPMSYDDLRIASGAVRQADGAWVGGTSYDIFLYVCATLVEVGLAERTDVPDGPGRPKVHFRWVATRARAIGAR